MKRTLIKIVATKGKPTMYFLTNTIVKELLLLDKDDNKKLKFNAFETFKMHTIELISYES